ncbi:hypothetical protein [Tessaracoccus coleopterorum]|uniref:hypothetical protein n=1 Tax=Tessaracoccus coleopterorum TaxID=2714950 RepID=UPI0018D46A78|nr:hypothetical protein [Tessaracoccus coleopterorum]
MRPEVLQPAFTALAAATALRDDATLCLTSALVHHDLSDAIPFASDIALPRGTHQPVSLSNVSWHSFDPATFPIGREHADAGGGPESRFTLQSGALSTPSGSCTKKAAMLHMRRFDVGFDDEGTRQQVC